MEPTPKVAILDPSRDSGRELFVSALSARLESEGYEVVNAREWSDGEDIVQGLDAVQSLIVVCGPGIQSFLDESVWLRAMLMYARDHGESGMSKFLPVVLTDDTEDFIPKFLDGQPFFRIPDGIGALVGALRSDRTPKSKSIGKSKRGRPQRLLSLQEITDASSTKAPSASSEPASKGSSSAASTSASPGGRVIEIFREFASGSLRKAQDEFSARYRRDEGRVEIEEGLLQTHVNRALRVAATNKLPIDVEAILLAALRVASDDPLEIAFATLSRLLPIESWRLPDSTRTSPPFFTAAEPFARSLEHALELVPEGEQLLGHDLVTAGLLTQGDPSLSRLAAEAGTSVPELQDRWFAFVTTSEVHRTPEQWQRWWRHAGVPLPSERGVRAGYFAESVRGEDRLGIEADVGAFARLIADVQTSPPLSISLIGDWGSGKSFFMERVRDRVEALEGSGPGLCQQVAQIRFSAWHYSDTNIWASLVGHIFDEVWAQMCPRPDDEQARAEVREQLKEAHGALFEAESEVEQAREVLEAAQRDEQQALHELAVDRFVDEQITGALDEIAKKAGFSAPLGSIVELEAARDQLRDQATRTRTVLEAALRRPALRSALLWVVGAIVVATGLTMLAEWALEQPWAQQTVQTLATVGGLVASVVGAIVSPLVKARGLLETLTSKVDDTIEEYERRVEAERSTPEGKPIVERTERARSELTRLRARADAARQRLAELERRQASLSPARRLTAFLESRAGADDYRSKQGIISLVRRDFDQLSTLMQHWRNDGVAPPDGVRPVDRIVLYIDDLDRCSPPLVVRTLEAIHLLLALDLFVVVVAVDSRWLLRALAVHYEDLLGARADDEDYRVSTPQSYLEKIFQVTFAVAPMTRDGFGRYVDFLAGRELPDEAPGEASVETRRPTEAKAPESDTGAAAEAVPAAEDAEQPEPEAPSPPIPVKVKAPTQPAPEPEPAPQDVTRALSVVATEREFLKQLHGMVTTPRLAKRLVNVFRLIKSRVPPRALGEFEAEGTGRHRPILLLLAILYGRPEHSLALFRGLSEGTLREDGHDDEPLHAALHRMGDGDLADWVQAVAPEVTVAACEAEAYPLARYSLVTGQHWHTWRRTSTFGPAELPS